MSQLQASSLNSRSKSLPIINALANRRFQIDSRKDNPETSKMKAKLPELRHIRSKEDEDLQLKLKHLQQRSQKKLEERYDTVDKWKKKYIPSYSSVLKHKLSLDSSRGSI